MNDQEALELLERELPTFRDEPFAGLARRADGNSLTYERPEPSGAHHQIEVHLLWDDRPGGDVRVMASIDDGGWHAFVPLTRSFIKRAAGSFVTSSAAIRDPRFGTRDSGPAIRDPGFGTRDSRSGIRGSGIRDSGSRIRD